MKLLITFLLLSTSAFAKPVVDISKFGDILQNEIKLNSKLITSLNSDPSTDNFEFVGLSTEVVASVGVSIPGIACASIAPEIELYFEK